MRRMNDGKKLWSKIDVLFFMNHSFDYLEYSEALSQMPTWKKVLVAILCLGTCCCFGGGFCCLCGCGCCCNFCCNHCCGRYKREEDIFSPFQV